jgi:hypothetical protein
MARLVWVGVGAVGGIYVYRKGERAVDAVREQGLAGTLQVVAAATLNAVVSLRSQPTAQHTVIAAHEPIGGLRVGGFRITRARDAAPVPQAAIMDTGVVDITHSAPRPEADRRRARTARRRKAG